MWPEGAEAPAPVLAEHFSVFLGLALRDLRLCCGTTPQHALSLGEVQRSFNPITGMGRVVWVGVNIFRPADIYEESVARGWSGWPRRVTA